MTAGEMGWVLETPGPNANGQSKSLYNETGARKRRQHQKSKKGCVQCKHRRVKCDEIRPLCGHCKERKWPCEFPSSQPRRKGPTLSPAHSEKSTDSLSPSPDSITGLQVGSRPWKHAQLLSCLERLNVPRQQPRESLVYERKDALELMDHFEDTTEPWIGSPLTQTMIQEHGLMLALQAPYLLHAILAYSASHLSHLHPEQRKYSVAARTHFTRSLQAYSTELVYEVEKGNANALLGASGMLAKLSFINTPVLSEDSTPFPATMPPWIRSMQGVKTIMSTPTLRKQLETGIFNPIVRYYVGPPEASPSDRTLTTDPPLAPLVTSLKALCQSPILLNTTTTTSHNPNVYTPALTRLETLMLSDPTNDKVDPILAFIATLEPSFLDLLEHGDERALLILAFWCSRIGVLRQWWTSASARAECWRICARLAKSQDARVLALLAFPARFCGFVGETASCQLPSPPAD
ncbi:hypothetical protein B0A50_04184 [Salinomyces thailandicus]|uniref:Zn(2)-C6 fungal-type domain-containing protein n=1 Tax=Salinomyces thailandicus TaxID=706561 RepID=A0A4U0U168_9PEZI|nr:hypothetical protein B0A50_04184 [Salinomyces thailandica]